MHKTSLRKKILNIGCGKGQNIPQLYKKGEIFNIDISPADIETARSIYPDLEYEAVKAEEMNFPEEFFDEIYCFDVLEHVEDFDLVMEKISLCLKKNGILYVEIPYERSEIMLGNINSGYFEQIGHRRVFEYDNIDKTFAVHGLHIVKKQKSRGIVNFYLWALFKLNIGLNDQMGTVKGGKRIIERMLLAITIWFDKNLFNTSLKYFPIWLATLPIGAAITQLFPKTIIIRIRK